MPTESNNNNHDEEWRKDPKLLAAYEKIKSELLAEENRDFNLDEPMIPFDQILTELEEFHQQLKAKRATG